MSARLVERDVGSSDDVCQMLDWLVKRDVGSNDSLPNVRLVGREGCLEQ